MSQPMTERQYHYLRTLVTEREYNVVIPLVEQLSILDDCYRNMKISTKTASEMIDKAKNSPKRTVKAEPKLNPPTLEDGIYVVDGAFFKVIHAIHGSGRQYAKKFNILSETWDYVPKGLAFILPTQKLTEEQAKEFGHLYGRCVVCGRTLTDEESISLGIGPVCRAKTFG